MSWKIAVEGKSTSLCEITRNASSEPIKLIGVNKANGNIMHNISPYMLEENLYWILKYTEGISDELLYLQWTNSWVTIVKAPIRVAIGLFKIEFFNIRVYSKFIVYIFICYANLAVMYIQ